ncbi:hypothetical protein FOL82_05255 [Lactobacillus reuteri]|uniref:hypothetical protein n=3 Tax=Limosilactobacillus reuteri TaxID=1598 RepID=UPI00146B2B4D|nr:hypothetical protein [Limosilactobacillus reuteri]NMV52394.1 hypothetical protein [Limosilactobacillus reuteri]NMV65233.1 hypothetical protein [Limosilactobacillus reuteri]
MEVTIKILYRKIILICIIFLSTLIFLDNLSGLNMYNSPNIWVAFLLNLFVVFLSLLFNGIDFVTMLLFCIVILLVPLMIQYFTGASYGILNLNIIQLKMPELFEYTFTYSAIFLLLSIVFNFKDNEYLLINKVKIRSSNYSIYFNNAIAIIFTIVAFPRLGFSTNAESRFDMLLPGHAWNQLVIVGLLFNLPYLKKRSVKITYLFVIFWFLIDGERADITGLFLGLFIYYIMTHSLSKNMWKIVLLIFILLFILIILNNIAAVRNRTAISNSLYSLLVTPTISDVGYLLNVAIDYLGNYGPLHGKILISNFWSAIPLSNTIGFTDIINAANYMNPGGEPFLAEPIMDFGKYGVVIIAFLDFLIFRFFVEFKNKFFKLEFLLLLCSIPRIVWYGRSYVYTGIIFFIPVLFIVNVIINKKGSEIDADL